MLQVKKAMLAALLLLGYDYPCIAQVPTDTPGRIISADVRWTGQFPGSGRESYRKRGTFGTFLSILSGDDRKGNVLLQKPVSVYAPDSKHIWIADQGSQALFRVSEGKGGVPKGFSKQKFHFQSLVGICPLPGKGLLFTDSRLNRIYLVDESGNRISVFSDSTQLQQPTGIGWQERHGEVWVVETAAHRISVFDREGRKLRSIGTRGSGEGEFNYPTYIWIDDRGRAYITDALNYRVQLLDDRGNYTGSFGEFGNASGYFASPKGVATDSFGNIYVADALFHVVQIFDPEGRFLLSFGSQGRDTAQFWMPGGVYIDREDNIFVADTYNARIQWFRLHNIIRKSETD